MRFYASSTIAVWVLWDKKSKLKSAATLFTHQATSSLRLEPLNDIQGILAAQGAAKLREVKVEGLEKNSICMHWGDNFFYICMSPHACVWNFLQSDQKSV